MRVRTPVTLFVVCALATAVSAQEAPPDEAPARTVPGTPTATSLDELLGLVEEGFSEERAANRKREAHFERAKEEQERLLEAANQVVRTAARWPAPTADLEGWERARRDLWDAAHSA